MIPPAFSLRREDGEVELAEAQNITTRQVAGEWVNSAEGRAWLKEHAVAPHQNAVAG